MLRGVRRTDDTVDLDVRGSKGVSGRFQLTFESAAPHRISGVGVELGDGAESPGLPPPPIRATMTPAELAAALDAYVADLAKADAFAGTVLVAKDGRLVFEKSYGLADRARKIPNTPATRFSIGSINKIFTKTLIAQLVAQGRIGFGDTIGKLLPDYPNEKARVATVEQLVSHQAGIADFFGPAFMQAPKTQFRANVDYYRFVAGMPLLFEPGTRRQYCNGCYAVLGEIIARVTGQPYEAYVAAHVFVPAGMKTAAFLQADRLPADAAVGYTRRSPGSGGALRDNLEAHGMGGSAAGGAYASAADLLAFDNALREGRLLDPKMTAWMFGIEKVEPGRVRDGLGVAGGAPGMNAILDSEGPWTVVVVGNLDPPSADGLGVAIRRQLLK